MPLPAALARADADLAAGRVPMARRRLRSLVSNHPTDLTARHRLAAVYRLHGEPAEAGRWNYLDESLTTDELLAFERRFHTPARRLSVLRWPDPAHNPPPTPLARRRLAALHRQATGTPPTWPDHPDDAATTGPPRPPRPMPPQLQRRPPQPQFAPHRPEMPMRVAAFRLALFVACGAALIVLVFR
ncbi:DUF6584 family protein [Kitasatospora sp. NPDC059673]|uniref:DUF6584 family protein n=1 Tax=Kitasatospora sp. NPDC059673 TaxID=3346901 RepID=UPI0036ACD0A0